MSSAATHATDHKPPLSLHFLTPLYDRVIAITLREDALRSRLVAQVAPRPGDRILDLGCGTGTLTALLKRTCPEAEVIGLDADAGALAVARHKTAGLQVELVQGRADAPPFEDGRFERVVSSLLFHHLSPAVKRATFAQVRRLLAPGGELFLFDWGCPGDLLMRAGFLGIQLLDGFETTDDNVRGRLPAMMREAGFRTVEETDRARTVFGILSTWHVRA